MYVKLHHDLLYSYVTMLTECLLFVLTGEKLIRDLLNDFLFPASKLISINGNTPSNETVIDVHPK